MRISKGEFGKNNFHVLKEQPPPNTCTHAHHMAMHCLKFNSSMELREEKQHYIEHSSSEKGAMVLLAKLSNGLPVEHAQRRKHNLGVRTSGTIWIPPLSHINWLYDLVTEILLYQRNGQEGVTSVKRSPNIMKLFTNRQEWERGWIWDIWTI